MATAVTCTCCLLKYEVLSKGPSLDVRGHCSVCKQHQSRELQQSLKRHQEHEEMLRERLERYSRFAGERQAEARSAKDKMHYAYRSRDKVVGYLRQIVDAHSLRANGECTCKARNCRVGRILDDELPRRLIENVDRVQGDMKAREETFREMERERYDYDEIHEVLAEQGLDYLVPEQKHEESAWGRASRMPSLRRLG